MLDKYLQNIFVTSLNVTTIPYTSVENLMGECCSAINSTCFRVYFVRVLAYAVRLYYFDQLYSLLAMTNYRDISEGCRQELVRKHGKNLECML